MITDFRLNTKNSNVQVKTNGKWYNLITFTDDCPYGKYGYKTTQTNKVFNPPIPLECDYKIGQHYAEVH